MSYITIFTHCVWRTKHGSPILTPENRKVLFKHILQNARTKDIHVDTVGGYVDHVHCLIELNRNSIAEVMRMIKGESSRWANKEGLFNNRLVWAEEYYAGSLSRSAVPVVRNYIMNQENHHRKVGFLDELSSFIAEYDLNVKFKPR